MSVAKLSDYRKPRIEAVESRVAQLEDGFLRLANELLDATMCSGLPETELCIVMAVWRKTYGYSKKMDWISNDQLEAMIGKHLTHCSTAKNSLVRKKVLLQEGRKVGMNTSVSEWETKNNGFCKTLAKPAKKTLAEVANGPSQKLLTTKDNIQKTKENTPLTPQGGDSEEAMKAVEFYNHLANASCRSAEPYLRLMTATASRKAYTLQDVCLVTRWALTVWKNKDKTLPKPENICRVKRFDGYLSDAEKWQRDSVEIDCQAVIDAYNEVTEGRMPPAELYRDREVAIRELVTVLAKKSVEGFRNYFKAFLGDARDFYFGGPDGSGWCANFDTLMKPEMLRKVKEGSL